MNSVELTKYVEDRIKCSLIADGCSKLKLEMYQRIANDLRERKIILTAGFFNRVVADMKRTGIVGTAKGGDYIFLSESYLRVIDKIGGGK